MRAIAKELLWSMVALCRPTIYAKWYGDRNWGDALNPYLISAISGATVVRNSHNPNREKFLVVGSVMSMVDKNTTVWGAGCIEPHLRLEHPPKRVCAVRGPLTRDVLTALGIDVPEIYGDPALLMPRFYKPISHKHYSIGIVPHYVDQEHEWVKSQSGRSDVLVIDVRSGTLRFIDSIRQCCVIISSSLHGIICANAYGIPAIWVELSDQVIGDGFKFHDYFRSINRTNYRRIMVSKSTTIEEIMSNHEPYDVDIDLDLLYDACPFRSITAPY